jgi:predicted permease
MKDNIIQVPIDEAADSEVEHVARQDEDRLSWAALLESVWNDTTYALRKLTKAPTFAAAVIVTLALGIGANTSIFTLIHSILLRSLPVGDPKMLYRLGDKSESALTDGFQNEDGDFDIFSYNLYTHLQDATPEFSQLAAMEAGPDVVSARRPNNSARAEPIEFVSGNYFNTLGVGTYAGRPLTSDDDRPGAAIAVVMSYQAWRSDYASDPSMIGSTFYLQGQPVTVAGIAASGFYGDRIASNPPAFWVPLSAEPLLRRDNSTLKHSDENWLYVLGRIRPGVAIEPLQQKISANLRQWIVTQDTYIKNGIPPIVPRLHVVLTPGGGGIQDLQQKTSKELYLLLSLAGFVLLVACANVANLMLARATRQKNEILMRVALGSARSRLVRQMLIESVVLGCVGGLAGLVVAYAGARAILMLAFPDSRFTAIDATPSLSVLAFAFLLAFVTGVIFGIVPAWVTSRCDPAEILRGGSHSASSRVTLPQRLLIVVQVTLSLVLLTGAGLLIRSLQNLEHQNFGLQTTNRYVMHVNPADAGYDPEQLDSLHRSLEEQFSSIPGIESVGLALFTPLDGNPWGFQVFVPGRPPAGPDNNIDSLINRVNADYFKAIGQTVLRGRAFTRNDTGTSPQVAIVNEAFVKKFFPGQDPIGLRFGNYDSKDVGACEIVGVVADAKYTRPRENARPIFFRPLPQWQGNLNDSTLENIETQTHYISAVVMNFHAVPPNLDAAARRALANVNPNLAIIDLRSLDNQLESNFNQERMIARLSSLFGLLTLVLAAVGLYGISAYQVTQRTREIGLRMALGASRNRVLNLIMRAALVQAAIGLVLGIPIALFVAHYLASQLYQAKPYDPLSLLAAVVVLAGAMLCAVLVPAWRAASIDPMQALRVE